MTNKNIKLTNPELLLLLSGFAAMLLLLFTFNRPAFYDEDDYLINVLLLQEYGFSHTYLLKLNGSAGPLYSIVHYLLHPVTQLQAPYIRLVNIFLLVGMVCFTSLNVRLLGFSSWTYALCVMAIPLSYVAGGLALTEMPAMFFLSAGVYLIIQAALAEKHFALALLMASAGGLCVCLAILGRQPYLLILAAIPVLFFPYRNYRNYLLLLITLGFSLALPGYIFFIWKGLVAPYDAALYKNLAVQGVSYRPEFIFICLGYFSMIFAIIAPAFYFSISRKTIYLGVSTYLLLAAINLQFELIKILPLEGVVKHWLKSPALINYAECLSGAGFMLLGIFFLSTLLRQLHYASYQKHLVFYSIAMLVVAFSCVKITWGFSSRYAAQAIPFLIPLGSYFYNNNKTNIMRFGTGILIGLISYISYLKM